MLQKIKQNKNIVIVLLILVIMITYSFVNKPKEEKLENKPVQEKEEKTNNVYVDIKGQVNNIGVYKMKSNQRVIDLINEAGGLTKYADTSNINLAQKLKDEMVVIVSSRKDLENNIISNNSIDNNEEDTIETNTTKININTASIKDLQTLSGVGESKAKNIIKYREKNKFNKIEDIKNVKGIGDSLFEKIKDHITT